MKNFLKVPPAPRLSRSTAWAMAAGLALASAALAATDTADVTNTLPAELEAGQSTEYALTRCAGIHFALISWAGASRLGAEAVDASKQNIFNLIEGAVQIRADAGDAQATANVVTKVHEFSVSYLNAFSEAAATEGATLAGNALIGADGETCGVFIEELQ